MEKILLLNFTQKESDRLAKSTGLTVHRGYIDPKPGFIAERDGSRNTASPQFYAPNSFYEYAAIFINLDEKASNEKEFKEQAKLWQERDRENLVKYWYERGGLVVVFLGDCGYSTLRVIGLPAETSQAEKTDTKSSYWPFSDFNTDFRLLLARLNKSVKMPAGRYIQFDDKLLDNNKPSIRQVYFNANNDVLGAYVDNASRHADTDHPLCMLLPQFKDNINAADGLIAEIGKFTKLFPSLKSSSWQSSDDYLPSEVREFDKQINELREKHQKELEALRNEQDNLRKQYSHLRGLLTNQDEALVADVEWALKDVLGIPVSNSDVLMKSRVRKEDLVLALNGKTVLAEVKGTDSQNPSPAYVSQLLTHAALNKKPEKELNGCMLIINYDLNRQPEKRPIAYSGELQGLLDDISFLDTRVLYAVTLAVLEKRLTQTQAIKILEQTGRIELIDEADREDKE